MTHDPTLRCEQFCTDPIGPDGFDGGIDWKNCCPTCDEKLRFLSHEVMPAIRKHGYYAPADASPEEEVDAIQAQAGFRPAAADLLSHLLGPKTAEALGWGPRDGETS